MKAARSAAPGRLDDEQSARVVAATVAVEAALLRLQTTRTTAKLTNRIPSAVRVLRRAHRELSADKREAWLAVAASPLAELEAVSKRLEEAHRIACEAQVRLAAVLIGKAA